MEMEKTETGRHMQQYLCIQQKEQQNETQQLSMFKASKNVWRFLEWKPRESKMNESECTLWNGTQNQTNEKKKRRTYATSKQMWKKNA